MLHEILLSLSGHPSPLLTADHTSPTSIFSPPEKALLASVAHLSSVHRKLITHTAVIATSHPSSICQAVATAISSVHLAQFQRKILDVEDGILRRDAGSVGAYNIVPLTTIVGEFSGWTRRMEWFLELVGFMTRGGSSDAAAKTRCTGAMVIDRLCDSIQTGYTDIEEAALSLVEVAETAWLKQTSAWILYGRLPTFGREDFFVRAVGGDGQYNVQKDLLPAFVSSPAATSLLFIGSSLNHIRVKSSSSTRTPELALLSSHLKQLSSLTFPIDSTNFSRVIASIRLSLSQTTLQKLLPLSRVVEILTLLREFFLLGRGEFAIALISEADEKIRSRWRRSDHLGYEKRDGLGGIAVKEGEVSAVLARTWTAMGSLQGDQEEQDDDDLLELARDLVQLVLLEPRSTPAKQSQTPASKGLLSIASTPFESLLLSVPVSLTIQIPSPLDLFLSHPDMQSYSRINAYLLSIHRAHLRLTGLWKITSLRRHHPAPPGPPYGSSSAGRSKANILRGRNRDRSAAMRSVWATSSAATFLLGETQAYLQGEVVKGTWDGFTSWLAGETHSRPSSAKLAPKDKDEDEDEDEDEDIWLQAGRQLTATKTSDNHTHDPQTLADAHRRYLNALSSSLLLTTPSFTEPLFHLLKQIDHLVALVHRVHSIWQSLDLEADEGVVDAFSDFHKEEKDVRQQLVVVSGRVKDAIEQLVGSLRDVDLDLEKEGLDGPISTGFEELVIGDDRRYTPAKVGRVDRLLMKLDFGGWFQGKERDGESGTGEGSDDGE